MQELGHMDTSGRPVAERNGRLFYVDYVVVLVVAGWVMEMSNDMYNQPCGPSAHVMCEKPMLQHPCESERFDSHRS